jgi:hypothetical protein
MAAGDSAFDVARRQREKAARLQRSAELWERGAHGEAAVGRLLAQLPSEWHVLHDLAWPGRTRANIDHVVIGPGGIFVIDAKNWSGTVEIRDHVLTQNGRRREGAVVSAAEAAIALQAVVPPVGVCMGVLCFVRDEPMTGWARDVMVCSTGNLVEFLLSRPPVLHREGIQLSVSAIRHHASRPVPTPMPTRDIPSRRRRSQAISKASATPGRTRRTRKHRSGRRLIVALAGLLAFGVWGTDLLARGGEWVGDRVAEKVTPEVTTPEPPPTPNAEKKRNRQKKNRGGSGAASQTPK